MIYGLKIFLFRDQLKRSPAEKEQLERFARFTCLVYIQHWVLSPSAKDAPRMDLSMFQHLLLYQSHDKDVADAVLTKFLLHTWYLNQGEAKLVGLDCLNL